MKKRVYSLLLALVLCLALAAPVFAADRADRLIDAADVLTAQEETELREQLNTSSAAADMEIAVYTVAYEATDADLAALAADYYDSNFGSADGILLLLAPTEDREDVYYEYCTTGDAVGIFDDDALDRLDDAVLPALRERNFSEACMQFADASEDVIGSSGPNYVGRVIVSLLVGAVLSFLIPMSVLKGQLKSVRSQAAASNYVRAGSMNLTQQRDIYLYRRVTRTAKPKNNSNSSGGGGSHGGRGGKV